MKKCCELIKLNKCLKELSKTNWTLKAIMYNAKGDFKNVPKHQQKLIKNYLPLKLKLWEEL